jgi:hypothetical protein
LHPDPRSTGDSITTRANRASWPIIAADANRASRPHHRGPTPTGHPGPIIAADANWACRRIIMA